MKKWLFDLYNVCTSEFKVVFRDPAIALLLIIVPLMYPVLYVFLYNNEVVSEVKAVIVDKSSSTLSREFARKLDATHDVEVVAKYANLEEAQEAMRRKQAYAIVYIPPTFSKDINTGKQATILIYSDMGSMLFYKAVMLASTEVSIDMGANIRISELGHGTKEQDESTMQPVSYEWVSLYNVPNGFASFLVPAILILIIQQTMLLGIGTIIGTHNDRKSFDKAACRMFGVISPYTLTLGKAFCYISIYLVSSAWILRIVPYLFRLPQIGDPFTIALFILPFILAATFFAMSISYFCSQREFIMLLIVFTSVPFLFLSGISWPWTGVPNVLKAIAYILPSTPGIHGFIKINTMGADLSEVKFEYITLWIHTIFYFLIAVGMFKWWIKNYDNRIKSL